MQGLKNLGSTCAINSLIQIICRNNYLRNSILNEDIPEYTLAYELKEILKILYINKKSVSPNKFINAIYLSLNNLSIGEQHDITELWFLLFDKISDEINIIIPKIEYKREFENLDLNDALIYSKADYIINKLNNSKTSKWLNNTQGTIINTITCNNCNYLSYNFEPFIAIQLDLPNNDLNSISLTKLFRNYLKTIVNKDEWKCDKCNKCTEYTKNIKLWKLPNVLIFLLKRYNNLTIKNTLPIDINNFINIKKGCILSDSNLELNYSIKSIGMHVGNLNSGHYYAICENEEDGKYILYDDLNIKVFNKDNNKFLLNNTDAYMIVYSL